MSDAKAPQEPSMEEILASIRRIISEDSDGAKPAGAPAAAAPQPAPAAAAPQAHVAPAASFESHAGAFDLDSPLDLDQAMQMDEDILDLTQRADPMGDTGHTNGADSMFGFESESDIDADEMHVPEVDFSDGLMSRASANAAEDAFARLSAMEEPEFEPEPEPVRAATSSSVDGVLEILVKDALKPVLKQWLDDHLPPMVEDLVRVEIQRLAQAKRK